MATQFSTGDKVSFRKQVQSTGTVVSVEGKALVVREDDGSEHRVVANFAKKL